MENNRRSFFKGLAAFASGVVAAKVASYTPKKEQVLVPSTLTIHHEGKDYHPLVVEKTDKDQVLYAPTESPSPLLLVDNYKATIRKANI